MTTTEYTLIPDSQSRLSNRQLKTEIKVIYLVQLQILAMFGGMKMCLKQRLVIFS